MNKLPARNIILIGLVSSLMVGCATREDVLYRYQRNCLDYGFAYGSSEFSRCMLEQEKLAYKNQRHYEHMAERRQAMAAVRSLPSERIPGKHIKNQSYDSTSYQQNINVHNTAVFDSSHRSPSHQPDAGSFWGKTQNTDPRYFKANSDTYKSSAKTTGTSGYGQGSRVSGEPKPSFKDELKAKVAEREARLKAEAARAEQIRKDEELARRLQAEENARAARAEQIRKDEELARRLQEQEYAKIATPSSNNIPPAPPPPPVVVKKFQQPGSGQSFREELAAKVAERQARLGN